MHRDRLRIVRLWLVVPALIVLCSAGAAHRALAGQNDVETESARIWVGKKAAVFTLPDTGGKPVNIARSLRKHPVVLVFYRGVW